MNFNQLIDRKNLGSVKWSFPELFLTDKQASADPLPLWVADMDFPAPEAVIDAIKKHASDPLGYSKPTQGYYEALYNWQKDNYGWSIENQWVLQTPGVVAALNIAIQAFTSVGDDVLVQPPVYVHFFEDVKNNGRNIVQAPLTLSEDGRYTFDAAIFEAAITPKTKVFILCNPHNPTGNVWSREDLLVMGEICLKHNVLVISDEIHQDLIFNSAVKHVAFAGINESFQDNSIVCTAPSKTFNIAGLQVANIIIANPKIRSLFQQQMVKNGTTAVNYLGLVACEAAYKHGHEWLQQVLEHIRNNQSLVAETIQKSLPFLKVTPTDALFLTWIDFRALDLPQDVLMDRLVIDAGLWLDNGLKFGSQGQGFMRMNVGCTQPTLELALKNLVGTFQ